MLILVEGTLRQPLDEQELAAVYAWVRPMVDDGFAHNGYVDRAKSRLWFVVAAPDVATARTRLGHLPTVGLGGLELTLTPVTAFRYT